MGMRNSVVFFVIILSMRFASAQPANNCGSIALIKPVCSFTAVNGSCTITVDRLNPATPPTIYARRGSVITVRVAHPTQFETLTLDAKSTTTVLSPDTFATGFASISANIAKLSVAGPSFTAQSLDGGTTIADRQDAILKSIQAKNPLGLAKGALAQISLVLQPPPGDVCFEPPSQSVAWLSFDEWKKSVDSGLSAGLHEVSDLGNFEKKSNDLDKAIDAVASSASAKDPRVADYLKKLGKNQDTLKSAIDGLKQISLRLTLLMTQVDTLAKPGKDPFFIQDLQSNDKNYQTEQWALNYTNKLSAPAKRAAAATFVDDNSSALAGLTDTPNKTAILTLTVQYQSSPRFEVSTGVMVPVRPFHSYAAAAQATNGAVTANVVQETLTYTVVPMASVNTLIGRDLVVKQQRVAFFGTVAVGYNPASSSVEFGVGPSFSWRSIMISGLADIGRDTQLAGGFTVGQTLAVSNPAKPLTTTRWSAKGAVALSVRIPLGGSGK